MPEKDVTLSYHPDYLANLSRFTKYLDLFEGDHDTLVSDAYLWPHALEKATVDGRLIRAIRQERTRYTNFIEPIISSYISLLFKKDPVFDEVRDLFSDEELSDIDGNGKSFINFIKEDIATQYLLFGRPHVLVDSYGVGAYTVQEERERGLRPFMEIISRLEVVDWIYETGNPASRGKYKAFRSEYVVIEDRENLESEIEEVKYTKLRFIENGRYKIRTYRQKTSKSNVSAKNEWERVGADVVSNLTEIPVSFLSYGDSWIRDTCEEVLRYHNLQSTRDNILNHQGYQDIYIVSDMEEKDFIATGEYVKKRLPPNSNVISIPPSDTTAIETALAASATNIYKTAFNKSRLLPADSRAVQGEGTLREEKEELLSLLISSIGEIEDVVNGAVKHWARFRGLNDYEGRVSLSKDLGVEDIEKQMRIFAGSRDLIAMSPTWKKSVAKKFAQSMDLPDIEDIEREIDSARAEEPVSEGETRTVGERLRLLANG